eukprot:3785882-Amphidinium_carterae.1
MRAAVEAECQFGTAKRRLPSANQKYRVSRRSQNKSFICNHHDNKFSKEQSFQLVIVLTAAPTLAVKGDMLSAMGVRSQS